MLLAQLGQHKMSHNKDRVITSGIFHFVLSNRKPLLLCGKASSVNNRFVLQKPKSHRLAKTQRFLVHVRS